MLLKTFPFKRFFWDAEFFVSQVDVLFGDRLIIDVIRVTVIGQRFFWTVFAILPLVLLYRWLHGFIGLSSSSVTVLLYFPLRG